jgi:hypothetical protein
MFSVDQPAVLVRGAQMALVAFDQAEQQTG